MSTSTLRKAITASLLNRSSLLLGGAAIFYYLSGEGDGIRATNNKMIRRRQKVSTIIERQNRLTNSNLTNCFAYIPNTDIERDLFRFVKDAQEKIARKIKQLYNN